LAEELAKAQSHVHLAGWFVSPHFALVREPERVVLLALLTHLAERIPAPQIARSLAGLARRRLVTRPLGKHQFRWRPAESFQLM
jgi:hypothetical protein